MAFVLQWQREVVAIDPTMRGGEAGGLPLGSLQICLLILDTWPCEARVKSQRQATDLTSPGIWSQLLLFEYYFKNFQAVGNI